MNARNTTTRWITALLSLAMTWSALADNLVIRDPTFEELANLTVASVTGTVRPQFTSPAASSVLTAEELHYIGVRNIPDALRFAPGMQVSQFDARRWSVATRGYNTIAVDKLLVLVDGRSVYTPLWSGVYWEQHAWLDPDLERIEVIRGPAGSVWGTNAVNGIVNILSRSARDTQGTAATVGTGTEETAFGSFRYGGSAGDNAWYRAYIDYSKHDDSELDSGRDTGDAWDMGRVGFRYDREHEGNRSFIKAEIHSGDLDEPGVVLTPTPPFEATPPRGFNRGGFLQASHSQRLANGAVVAIGAWYERLERRLQPTDERSDTFDVGARYDTRVADIHAISGGALYRHIQHETNSTFTLSFSPADRTLRHWSAFLQDEIKLTPRLNATLGVRVEDPPYTGPEWLPNLRVSFSIADQQLIWAAVGRALRTPTFADESRIFVVQVSPPGTFGPGSPRVLRQVLGSPNLESEELVAYEMGWRGRWGSSAMLTVSAFYNDYDRLILYSARPLDRVTLAPDFWRVAVVPDNRGSAWSRGGEITGFLQPLARWRLYSELSYLDLQARPVENELASLLSGSSARLQGSVRSHFDLAQDWQLGMALRYVEDLPALDVSSFVGADLRIAKQLSPGLQLALVGQNLWQSRHAEFRSSPFPLETHIERSFYLALTWRG